MTESISPPDTADHAEPSPEGGVFVPATRRRVTVGDRAGGRGQGAGQVGGAPPAGSQRAGDARAPARDQSLTQAVAVTLRRAGLTRTQLWDDVAPLWKYIESRAWLRGSKSKAHLWVGLFWYVGIAVPATLVLSAAVKTVRMLFSRFTITVAAAAMLTATYLTWPSGEEPAPLRAPSAVVGEVAW